MKKKGFTLIELIAVITIIVILGAIGAVGYRSFFDNGKSSYYKSVESDILLSANDYFLDNRDVLPVTSNFKEVNLNELVDKKYVEEVLNSKGEKCDGKVIVYKENGKYSYDVCLDCGDYKSNGAYCEEGAIPKTILITARTSNTNSPYNVTASFDEVEYTNNESVIVSFDMEDVEVSKYEIVNTMTGEQLVCNSFAAGGNKCDKIIDKTGTYSVTSYDKNENILISNQQFNVKILDNGLNFTIDGIDEKYKINVDACTSGSKKIAVSFKVKKANLADEYKKVEYKLRRNEVDGAYKEIDNLEVTETLESGHYELEVRVTNFVGATTIRSAIFNVTYDVNLEYDDGSTGTHEVVKGYAYDYLSELPTHKNAYGVDNLEVKWYKDDERIYGTTTVEDGCTHKIIGKMIIQVDVPRDWTTYCNALTYNGESQTLTKTAPSNVTFVNTSGTDAKKYTVSAHVNAPLYVWKDGTFADKTFECEIGKRDVTVTATDQKKVYDGTALNADNTCTIEGQVTGHTLTCTGNSGTITNEGSVTKTLGTPIIKSGSTDVTSNYSIRKVNGLLAILSQAQMIIENAEDNSCNPLWIDDMETTSTDDDIVYFSGEESCIDMNYVWYSGKLWRIVAIYPDGRMKLITDNSMTNIYWGKNTSFNNSWIYQWLNEDFYDSLYNANSIIDTSATWNNTIDSEGMNAKPSRPETLSSQNVVTAKVGLLNMYEYYNSGRNARYNYRSFLGLGYGFDWWLITPYSSKVMKNIQFGGGDSGGSSNSFSLGVRPSIIIKSGLSFSGNGTKTSPYRINTDKASATNGTLLNTRLSGEYVKFDNKLYRIVNVDNGQTRIVMADLIRDSSNKAIEKYVSNGSYFGKSSSSNDYWDYYLNNTWYNSISSDYKSMIVDGTYYLGSYPSNYSTEYPSENYKKTICKDTNLDSVTTNSCTKYTTSDSNRVFIGKVGLLRVGEMFSTMMKSQYNNGGDDMWLISPTNNSTRSDKLVSYITDHGDLYGNYPGSNKHGVRPVITIQSSIKIKGGSGTEYNPYNIGL